jgi:hypothetical protein
MTFLAAAPPEISSRHDRWFYAGMATLLAVVIGAGFTPTFFARGAFSELPPLSWAALLHGLAGTAWLALLVAQAWLIVAGRRDRHRWLGVAGVVLAPLFVVSGIAVIAGVERSHVYDSAMTLAAHVYANGAPVAAFGTLAIAGLMQRRVPARHKRLMLLAAITLLPPGTGRLFGYLGLSFLNVPVYIGALFLNVVYDVMQRRRPHAISLVGAVVLAGIELTTDWWLAAIGS